MISRERQIEIEIEVKEMLKEYELATYPISISKVAKALGIDLIPYSSLAEKERNLAFTASEDAFSICSPDLTIATIVFNDTNGPTLTVQGFLEGTKSDTSTSTTRKIPLIVRKRRTIILDIFWRRTRLFTQGQPSLQSPAGSE